VLDGVFLPRDLAELSAAGGKVVAELWRQLDAEGFFE
jgi:hypothetical protein